MSETTSFDAVSMFGNFVPVPNSGAGMDETRIPLIQTIAGLSPIVNDVDFGEKYNLAYNGINASCGELDVAWYIEETGIKFNEHA